MEQIELRRFSHMNSDILKEGELKDYYQSIFLCCDTDKDGVISISELKNFIATNEDLELTDDVTMTIHRKYDKNMDEKLDFEEFVEMINSRTFVTTFRKISNRIMKFVVLPPINRQTLQLCRTVTATGSYENESKFKMNRVSMILLSFIQILIYYINNSWNTKDPSKGVIQQKLKMIGCSRCEIYRYFTYMLVHGSESHLYVNVVLQLLLGIPLELVHSWRIPTLYFAGVIGGALFHNVLDEDALVGCSGGVYSFLTAHMAAVILNWREMSHPAIRLILFATIIVIDTIFKNMIIRSGTSFWAHFGGAVIGLLLGVNILRNLRVTRLENFIWYISLVVLGCTIFILILLNYLKPLAANCP